MNGIQNTFLCLTKDGGVFYICNQKNIFNTKPKHKMENTSQFLHLTESEMLNIWKNLINLQPHLCECAIEREDGVDVDAQLLTRIRQWYAALLMSAPENLVPVEDVKEQIALSVADNGVVTAILPPHCVRPVEWKLGAWHKSVTLFLQPGVPEEAYLHNEWTLPGVCNPAAVDFGNRILLFTQPAGESAVMEMARCVVRPADGTYVFHSSALHTLPVW